MLSKNTIIDLWNELSDVPVAIDDANATVIDDPDGFLGWKMGTDLLKIWKWFDVKFAQWGGVYALMYDKPQQNSKF